MATLDFNKNPQLKSVGLNFDKGEPLDEIKIGLGWDVGISKGADLDASVVLLDGNGKFHSTSEQSICCFANKTLNLSPNTAPEVVHSGDNRTGEGEGYDEVITVKLAALPESVKRVVAIISIFNTGSTHKNFGQIKNAVAGVFRENGNLSVNGMAFEDLKFNLSEEQSPFTAYEMIAINRTESGWEVEVVSRGLNATIEDIGNKLYC